MRWEDERYVRVYTRDTTDWVALGWEAQALFMLTMRKVDRAGILELGKSGVRGLAALVAMPLETVERVLPVLLEDGCLVLRGSTLVIPNFIEAQEAKQSDAQRKRESRATARDRASLGVTNRDTESRFVTGADASGGVTSGSVTPSRAVPSRTQEPLVVEAAASGDAGGGEDAEAESLSLVADEEPPAEDEPLEKIIAVWDRVCVPAGFAKARSTPQQRKAARTRMREPSWFEAFEAACRYVASEPFYRGGGSTGWVATLGWMLKPGNAEKTAERAETRRASGIPSANQPAPRPQRLAPLGRPQ